MKEFIEAICSFDHTILLFIQENLRFDILTPVMKGVSFTVNLGFLWVFIGVIMLFFKKTRIIGAVLLSSLLVCLCINNIAIKNIVDRARPFETHDDLLPLIPKPKDSSFASGHTTASFAAACTLARFLNKPLAVSVVAYAAIVAYSRLYLGVHYPTDVVCGCLIGIFGSAAVYCLYSRKFDLSSYRLRIRKDSETPASEKD